ncbi:hypothetical protein II906_09200 [bacterium]|nr:hypothetical protein [bacterium]
MKISAVQATPIKPQSFGMAEKEQKEFDEYFDKADALYTQVQQSNVKKPVAIVASVALAGITAFLFGSKIAGGVARLKPVIVSPQIKNEAGELISNPKYFENVIKSGVNKVTSFASGLAEKGGNKAKVADLIGKGQDIAKKGYKLVTGIGTKNIDPAQLPLKKLTNLAGVATAAVMLPRVCKADGNKDGVADISQRGQSAYTGAKTEINNTLHKATLLGDLLDLFS